MFCAPFPSPHTPNEPQRQRHRCQRHIPSYLVHVHLVTGFSPIRWTERQRDGRTDVRRIIGWHGKVVRKWWQQIRIKYCASESCLMLDYVHVINFCNIIIIIIDTDEYIHWIYNMTVIETHAFKYHKAMSNSKPSCDGEIKTSLKHASLRLRQLSIPLWWNRSISDSLKDRLLQTAVFCQMLTREYNVRTVHRV